MNITKDQPVTLKLLANKLQMSVSAISKALSNHPAMNKETRRKVQLMAQQLHYTPNNSAINFRKGRTGIIGVIIPDLLDDFFMKFFRGLEQYASQNDYQIAISQTFDSTENEIKTARKFLDMKVDGLFVAVSQKTSCFDHLRAFEKDKIPVVYFARDPHTNAECHKVLINTYQGSFRATQYLINSGHTKIAFLGGISQEGFIGDRLNGYINCLKENKLFFSGDLSAYTDFEHGNLDNVIGELFLKENNSPNALLVGSESMLFNIVGKLSLLNPDLAKHLDYIVFGDTSLAQYFANPPICSVRENAEFLACQAMLLMMELITKRLDLKDYQRILVDSELVSPLEKT